MRRIFGLVICCLAISACGKDEITNTDDVNVQTLVITCDKMKEQVSEGAVLIDVRSSMEYDLGHIDGAVNIPVDTIETAISMEVPNKDTVIILYCQSGSRSKQAAGILIDLGYSRVYDLGSINNCD